MILFIESLNYSSHINLTIYAFSQLKANLIFFPKNTQLICLKK